MKIGVISDTHGSYIAWNEAYNKFFYNVDLIIHCGDVLYHGPRNPLPTDYNPKKLAEELNNLEKPIIFARGNCDAEVDQMVLDHLLQTPYTQIITPDWKILVHHGHHYNDKNLPACTKKHYNLIISGHTHLPLVQKKDNIIFLNPGSPSLPKSKDKIPTVALIENKTINIYNLTTGNKII